jgi:hypothetical protein
MSKKNYKAKFYYQKNGQKPVEYKESYLIASSNKEAFQEARREIKRIVQIDLNNFEGDEEDSRYIDIIEALNDLEANQYYIDTTNYFFKIFSKKSK